MSSEIPREAQANASAGNLLKHKQPSACTSELGALEKDRGNFVLLTDPVQVVAEISVWPTRDSGSISDPG